MKTCSTCEVEKPLESFHKGGRRSDGLQSRCKECACQIAKDWRDANRERSDEQRMLKRYGITPTERDAMIDDQGGLCALCGDPMLKPVIDHRHSDGTVRAILCSNCNVGIGMFQDDPERLQKAIAYLSRFLV